MVARDRTRLIDRLAPLRRIGPPTSGPIRAPGILKAHGSYDAADFTAGVAKALAEPPHRFVLRMPRDLHGRVLEAAARYRRSLNAEIVARLEHSLGGIPQEAVESKLEPALFPYVETTFRGDLTEQEDALVRLYRRLSASQRSALLKLLQ